MGLLFDNLVVFAVALAACVFAVIYVYFKISFTYWKKRNIPYVKPTFPFGNFGIMLFPKAPVGHIFEKFYKELDSEKYGGTYAFTTPGFIFRDPDIIKNVLVKDFSHFHDRGFFMDEEVEPLSGHLFLLPGNRWRNLRVKLSPTFTSGKMKMMFQTLADCGQELVSILEQSADNEEILEIKDILARYSTDVISSCAFGIQCNCLKNPDAEFREWGRKLFKPNIRNSIISFIAQTVPSLLKIIKLRTIDPNISKYFLNMVEDTVSYRERNNIKRKDFMHLLIQIKNKVKLDEEIESPQQNGHETVENTSAEDGLSMNSLAAQAFVFYLGGFETSSTTMTFCMYELSLHQDIQQRLQEEIDVVLKKHGGRVTYEAIQEMEYLDRVVSETLRKYPPLPMLNRECTKDYNIPGTDYVMEKGMKTVIPILALHHDPKYYPEPERFDPERFTENENAKRHHYVYLPFGEGPRICIGISMNSLAAQAFVFFVGGFETSSTTMTFCMYELSLHQDIQQRLREEIDDVLKKHGGRVTYEAIQEMEYLDRVVSETLRKYPPVPILNRDCTKDYNIPGTDVVLKKGMPTVIPTLALHYDPKYYPEPERFDPERFSEDEKAKRHHYVYLPFGEGPRICIGMRFGLMQTKVGLVSLLSKYQFSVSKKTPIPMVFDAKSFTLSPLGGMWLHIRNRMK